MSTLQQTHQQALRTRSHGHLALAAMLALVAAAAVTIVLVVSGGSNSSPTSIGAQGGMHGTPQQQLQAVSGARYGATRPNAGTPAAGGENASPTPAQLDRQLQAVAGARYDQPSPLGRNPRAAR